MEAQNSCVEGIMFISITKFWNMYASWWFVVLFYVLCLLSVVDIG